MWAMRRWPACSGWNAPDRPAVPTPGRRAAAGLATRRRPDRAASRAKAGAPRPAIPPGFALQENCGGVVRRDQHARNEIQQEKGDQVLFFQPGCDGLCALERSGERDGVCLQGQVYPMRPRLGGRWLGLRCRRSPLGRRPSRRTGRRGGTRPWPWPGPYRPSRTGRARHEVVTIARGSRGRRLEHGARGPGATEQVAAAFDPPPQCRTNRTPRRGSSQRVFDRWRHSAAPQAALLLSTSYLTSRRFSLDFPSRSSSRRRITHRIRFLGAFLRRRQRKQAKAFRLTDHAKEDSR